MKVYKGKYSQVHLIASLTAGLSRYHDAFAVAVVDEVTILYLPNLLHYISARFILVQHPTLLYNYLLGTRCGLRMA
jgi:hypothetical protein